ncbi:TMEM165/GDT1 family protein [Neisseria sp. Ec49-e6-T10]|uniref:TMEM165/GDT1 family protein n=1 Tax=Neisseria sp. Ec49-e6-T10 TaxID=3140744 RepID=UPI003EB722BF
MEAFLISTIAITLGEIGDKTQLLALILAARFKKPVPIILGILCATLLNHALAGFVGHFIGNQIPHDILRWVMGIFFIIMAFWTLKPDEMDEDEQPKTSPYGVFMTTCIAFFLAEMGDKTQVVTIGLAAQFQALFWVIAGTTLGMLIADIPAVILGKIASPKFPFKLVRYCAAAIFAVLGLLALFGPYIGLDVS